MSALPPPSVTFAAASAGNKALSDNFIIGLLTDTLESGPGRKSLFLKSYLDQVPADDSDRKFCRSPRALADFHERLASLIAGKLVVRVSGLDTSATAVVRGAKQRFLEAIAAGNENIRTYYAAWASWDGKMANYPRLPRRDLDFHGFDVTTTGGSIDLLDRPLPNVRPNFQMQREAVGLFVHWSSNAYLTSRMAGERPSLDGRIYLNPRPEDAVRIFDEITSAANDLGLSAKGKILERGIEGVGQLRRTENEFEVRADGIVLWAGEDADKLLAVVERAYRNNPEVFQGRTTPRIPLRIGDGIAVGSEPAASGKSLTSHRSEMLSEVAVEARRRLDSAGIDATSASGRSVAIATFRDLFNKRCIREGVNPNNLAFNARGVTVGSAPSVKGLG